MRRHQLLVCGAMLLAVTTWAAPPPDFKPLEEEDIASLAAIVNGRGDLESRKEAARQLVHSDDPRILPYVADLIDRDGDMEVRKLLVIGVARAFPDTAPSYFLDLARTGTPNQREAAIFVMGPLNDPRIMGTLEKYLMSDDERMRRAARFAISTRGRGPVMAAITRLTVEKAKPVPEESLKRLQEVRQTMRSLVAGKQKPTPEAEDMIWTFADYDLARIAQKRYLDALPSRDPLRPVMSKFFQANRHWLGRPPAPKFSRLDYTLHLQRVGDENAVTIPYWVDASGIDLLRIDGFNLDRGGRLLLPLDSLTMIPSYGKPTLVETGESGVRIRYDLTDRGRLEVGLGNNNLAYWEGKLPDMSHAIVTIDPERGVPVAEDVYMKDGTVGAHLTYDEYQKLGDGSWVPLRIEVDAPDIHVAARTGHMQYALRFNVLEKDTWLLAGASATELTPGGNQLRAYMSLRDPVVHP